MKKRVAVTMWAALLTILLLLAACGPAVSSEQADQMTAEAEAAAPSDETATEGEVAPAGEETAVEGEEAAGIPEVDGPITDTESGLRLVEIREGDGRTPEEGDLVTMHIMGMLLSLIHISEPTRPY